MYDEVKEINISIINKYKKNKLTKKLNKFQITFKIE